MRGMTRQELEVLGFDDNELAREYQLHFGVRTDLASAAEDTAELQARRQKMWSELSVEWYGQVERSPGPKIGRYADERGVA